MASNSHIIEKEHVYSGIIAGAERVSKYREVLNKSNGFPVPDMDTGNNLSYLMQSILRGLAIEGTIKDVLDNVSNLAIVGARGNSGAIFSQFFCGFSAHAPNKDHMTTEDLISCFQSGYQYAYKSIKEPVEGTIITVIRSWFKSLKEVISPQKSLDEIYKEAYPLLKNSVSETKNTIKVQRNMKSEDAGAKAFFYFIEGFMPMLVDKVTDYEPEEIFSIKALSFNENSHSHLEEVSFDDIENKYCTEVLIHKNSSYNRDDIESYLINKGDSLAISENDKLARIHIHTNEPSKIVDFLFDKGKILESKADDMFSQFMLSRSQKSKIALVIDSIADIDKDRLNGDTYLLPINILVDNISYEDKITISPKVMDSGRTSSSQPNMVQVKQFLEPIVEAYDDVIIITVSSKMSGVYDRFTDVIKSIKEKANIYLIDSKQNSVAEGLVVNYALELIKKGTPAHEIKLRVEEVIKRSKIYVCLPNLKAMVASGRLNSKVGRLLQYINFLPLISIDSNGEGVAKGIAFSNEKNRQLLINKVKAVKDNVEDYAVVHSQNISLAEEMAKKLTDIVGKPPLYIDEISSVIRMFSGPGSIAVGYITKEDK